MGLILAAISVPSIVAQDTQSAATKSAKGDGEYVSEKGFKNKLFQIKHRDPNSLLEVLKLLGSGFKGATISVNQEFKTITVRDFPENLATMEEALGRLDVPQPPRPDIEFRVYILIASSTPGAGDYPAELKDVIDQLRNTFKYKAYSLMTSAVHRTKDGPDGITNRGVADAQKVTSYRYDLRPISMDPAASGSATIRIGLFALEMRVPITIGPATSYETIGFRTPVNLREGEKVVVGTTTLEDKGLVVVLSAKVIK